MMDSNNEPQERVSLNETGSENGKDSKQLSDDNVTANRRIGVTDLWSIRNNARSFRIHSRIPRL
jgi:hypothetical protein